MVNVLLFLLKKQEENYVALLGLAVGQVSLSQTK